MSFALHRVARAWHQYERDPCAKNMLVLARLLAQHHYDPGWPCHTWIQEGHWETSSCKGRLHSALLSSLRVCKHKHIESRNILFPRLFEVAKWMETRRSLKNVVAVDQWCPLEWWVLGGWLDHKGEDIRGMSDFVAMWDPVWSLAVPLYSDLGWQKGLQALFEAMGHQESNILDSIDASNLWSSE